MVTQIVDPHHISPVRIWHYMV